MVLKAHTLTHAKFSRSFNLESSKDFWCKFLRFICTLCFNFLSLNLIITLSRFDIRWHAYRSSGTTFWPVNNKVLHIVSYRTLSWISWGTGFNSRLCVLWYCALLTSFFSKWMIQEYNRELHLVITTKSDLGSSYFLEKLSNLSVSSLNRSVLSDSFTSSSTSSSLLIFSIWLLVKTTLVKILKDLRRLKRN